MTEPEITDEELRALCNAVYRANTDKQIQTDESWEMVKDKWREDVAWLMEKAGRESNNPTG